MSTPFRYSNARGDPSRHRNPAGGGRYLRFILTVVIIVVFLAYPSNGGAQAGRRLLSGTFHLDKTIGVGTPELYMPDLLATTLDGLIVVFDRGDMQLRAFDTDGREAWQLGRKGGGPSEFYGAQDLQVDQRGDLLVLDNDNARVTRVSPGGTVRQMTRIPKDAAPIRGLLPFAVNGFTAVPSAPGVMLLAVAAAGLTKTIRYPKGIIVPNSINGAAHTTGVDGGAAIAFRWSSRMIVLNADGSVRRIVDGIEPAAFPPTKTYPVDLQIPEVKSAVVTRVDPAAVECALDVAGHKSLLYVLYRGKEKSAGRIVDVYDIDSGTYVGSHVLPVRPSQIALLPDGRLVTLEAAVLPVLKIWRFGSRASKE